jgi:hypothetical protein
VLRDQLQELLVADLFDGLHGDGLKRGPKNSS